jgi:demethoxyubiquinone hydroxylase (CLK1/Coq7/Cat5 family)
MQKFSVSTSKGFIHTTEKILEYDYEEKKRQLKKAEQELREEFESLIEHYTPKTKEELIKSKGGK